MKITVISESDVASNVISAAHLKPRTLAEIVLEFRSMKRSALDAQHFEMAVQIEEFARGAEAAIAALQAADATLLKSMQLHGCDPCHITEARESIAAAIAR